MKKLKKTGALLLASLFLVTSCSKGFFEKNPPGVASEAQFNNKKGVDQLLIAAYSLLDGIGSGSGWTSDGASKWILGDLVSGDAVKGSSDGDEAFMTVIETFNSSPSGVVFEDTWVAIYDGVSRANDVLRSLAKATDVSADDTKRLSGEARFLRGFYHFEAAQIWKNVPFIDETMVDTRIPNKDDVYPKIEADLQYAIDNLPATQGDAGRINKWGAIAFLVKVYMQQNKFTLAKPLLEDLINNGVTAKGEKYGLETCYDDNFNADFRNGKESVFAYQASVSDGGEGFNSRYGDVLNAPLFGDFCCGFFQPTHNLVNSFKVDAATGLPLLDTYNDTELKNDEGIPPTTAFVPTTDPIDPRLDFTVGRRGVPYLGWGLFQPTWIKSPSFSGPYQNRKWLMRKYQKGSISATQGPGWSVPANYEFIRFADILLWRAEVAAEESDLGTALTYVNQVRNRSKNGCKLTLDNSTTLAANYKIEPYPAFPNKDYAIKAVRFERRIEFAMEGNRFYDLVRWGIAGTYINAYLASEKRFRTYLNGVSFVPGKHELMPLPQSEINNGSINGVPVLQQNPNY